MRESFYGALHLFYENDKWYGFFGELPDKEYDKGCHVCDDFNKTEKEMVCKCYHDYQKELSKIATLKKKASLISNPEEIGELRSNGFFYVKSFLQSGASTAMRANTGYLYTWRYSYQLSKELNCDVKHIHTWRCYKEQIKLLPPPSINKKVYDKETEAARAYLKSEGLDPDQIAREGSVFVKTLSAKIRLEEEVKLLKEENIEFLRHLASVAWEDGSNSGITPEMDLIDEIIETAKKSFIK
jgi:hypothetical protein